jgi:hypothetical protein
LRLQYPVAYEGYHVSVAAGRFLTKKWMLRNMALRRMLRNGARNTLHFDGFVELVKPRWDLSS